MKISVSIAVCMLIIFGFIAVAGYVDMKQTAKSRAIKQCDAQGCDIAARQVLCVGLARVECVCRCGDDSTS